MIVYNVESKKISEMINNFASARTGEILNDLIEEDLASEEKKRMNEGVAYYSVENTEIKSKQFDVAYIGGENYKIPNTPNNKRKHAYYRIVVNQKVGYIDEPSFSTPNLQEGQDDIIKEQINNILGETFPDLMNDWETGASNKGREYLHPYINSKGLLDFVIFPATQIIPIYDTKFQKELVSAIRYYPYELVQNGTKKELYEVEIYTDKEIHYYTEVSEGKFEFQETKQHFEIENSVNGVNGLAWNKVPLIELANNTERLSDLYLAKDLIDDYDLHKSVFSNDLESIQQALLHIQGYDVTGTPEEQALQWATLKKNILTLKMVLTNDKDASVSAITNEIPHAAKDSHLDRTRKELFTLFMGVDPELVGDGNITNIVIKARYMLLDMKAELMIAKIKKATRELLWFIAEYIKYNPNMGKPFDYNKVNITVNRNMMINDAEIIQNLVTSGDLMSKESKIAKHPYIEDVQAELEKLDKENQAYMDQINVIQQTQTDNVPA